MLRKISKSAATLLSGTVAGQLIVLAASPLLTRLYTPEQFGEFSIYVVILYVFMSIGAGRYDAAITVAASTKDANSLFRYSIIFSTATATLALIVLTLYTSIHKNNFLETLQFLLPISILFAGINTAFVNIELRRHKQFAVAKSRTLQALTSSISQLLTGSIHATAFALIAGQTFGLFSSIIYLSNKRILKILGYRRHPNRNNGILKKYAAFPKFEMVSALAAVANNHLPTILIGILSTTSNAGAYALAQRIIATPLNIVAGSIASSTLAYGRIKNKEKDRIIISAVDSLGDSINSLIVLVGVFLIYAFGWIFGNQWSSAGTIAGWICLTAGSKFKSDSIFAITTTTNRQREGLFIQLTLIVFKAAPLAILLPLFSINFSIIAYSLINAASHHFATKKIAAGTTLISRQPEYKFWGTLLVSSILLLSATYDNRTVVAIALVIHSGIALFSIKSTIRLFRRAE